MLLIMDIIKQKIVIGHYFTRVNGSGGCNSRMQITK